MDLEGTVRRAVSRVAETAQELAKEEGDEGGAIIVIDCNEPHPQRTMARGFFRDASVYKWTQNWPEKALEAAFLGPMVHIERLDVTLLIGVAGMPSPCQQCIEEATRLEILKAIEDAT